MSSSSSDHILLFDCLGKIVKVIPSPGFWPRAKGTIFELSKKYNKKESKPIFVPLRAELFRTHLAPIFDLGYVSIGTSSSDDLNVRKVIRSWISDAPLWDLFLDKSLGNFLGNIFKDADLLIETHNNPSIKNSTRNELLKTLNLFNDRYYCSSVVKINIKCVKKEHEPYQRGYYEPQICGKCGSRNFTGDCVFMNETLVIISHSESRDIEFGSTNPDLCSPKISEENKQKALKIFFDDKNHSYNYKIYKALYEKDLKENVMEDKINKFVQERKTCKLKNTMDGFLITETWLLRIQPGLNDDTVRDIKFEYNIQSKKITYLAHLGNFSKKWKLIDINSVDTHYWKKKITEFQEFVANLNNLLL